MGSFHRRSSASVTACFPSFPALRYQLGEQVGANVVAHAAESGVKRVQILVQYRFPLGEDRIQRDVLRDASQGYVGNRLVLKAGLPNTVRAIRCLVVVEIRGQDALSRQRDPYAAGVYGYPAAPPLLGDVGSRAGATGGVQHEIAGVRGHEHAALDHHWRCFDDIVRGCWTLQL